MGAKDLDDGKYADRIESIAELRRFLVGRIRDDDQDYDAVAAELKMLGVALGKQVTGFQVLSLCKGLAVGRRRGPKPSKSKQVWRDEVQVHLEGLSDAKKAEVYRSEVIPALKLAKRDGATRRSDPEPSRRSDFSIIDSETGEPWC